MPGTNMYYLAVKEFLDENRADFDRVRIFTGMSVHDLLLEVMRTGIREEVAIMEMLQQDIRDNEVGE